MQERLATDAAEYAAQLQTSTSPRCLFVLDAEELVYGPDGAANLRACEAAQAALSELIAELTAQRDRDAAHVREALPQIMRRANAVSIEGVPAHARQERELFGLRQTAEQEATLSLDFMFCLLISTRSVDDLRTINPFVTASEAAELFGVVVSSILHASRVGQINRCLSEAHGLLKLLKPHGGRFAWTDAGLRDAVSAITLKAQTFAEQLLTQRHYVGADGAYDPRFLLFEFTHNIVLREPQVREDKGGNTRDHHSISPARRRPSPAL